MKKKMILSVISLSLFSSVCAAHHSSIVPVKVVVPAKVVPVKVVLTSAPKVVVTKNKTSYLVYKTKPKNGVCFKRSGVWHCRK